MRVKKTWIQIITKGENKTKDRNSPPLLHQDLLCRDSILLDGVSWENVKQLVRQGLFNAADRIFHQFLVTMQWWSMAALGNINLGYPV